MTKATQCFLKTKYMDNRQKSTKNLIVFTEAHFSFPFWETIYPKTHHIPYRFIATVTTDSYSVNLQQSDIYFTH